MASLYSLCLLPLLLLFPLVATQDVLVGKYNTVWTTPTVEDDPMYYKGGMPLGNGDTQVLSWANTTQGGVSLYVSKQDAMHSDTSNFKLALLTLTLDPNPFNPPGSSFFNQTLDIASGTMFLTLGGTKTAPSVTLTVYVDANSNTVFVTAHSLTSQLYTFTALLTPVRPDGYAPFVAPWQCTPVSSAADEVVDPLPPTNPPFPSPGGTLVLLHSNLDTDYTGVGAGGIVNLTLSQQGLGDPEIVATVPDLWRGRKFGVAVDTPPTGGGDGCATLTRLTSPLSLHSTAPASCAIVRISTFSSTLYPTRDEWVGALAAQVAMLPPTPPRSQHEAYWRGFWSRSFVDITTPNATSAATFLPPSSMPSGYTLWLRASTLAQTLPNNSAVCAWGDGVTSLTQPNATQCPVLLYNVLGRGGNSTSDPPSSSLLPGVRFTQALHTYLNDQSLAPPASRNATILVVFKDMGSNGGEGDGRAPCCSGVVSMAGSFLGVSTLPSQGGGGGGNDDDNPLGPPTSSSSSSPPTTTTPVSVLGDFGGSNLLSSLNVLGRTVVAAVTFDGATTTAALFLDGCAQGSQSYAGAPGGVPGLMVGSRGADVYERYFEGVVGEVVVFPRLLTLAELGNATALLASEYNLTYYPPSTKCGGGSSGGNDGYRVSQTYAMSRYVNTIQSRVVGGGQAPSQQQQQQQQPIKFNGLSWTSRRPGAASAACSPHPLGPDCREWGPNNWWQNLRLPYWPMLADGDWLEMDIGIDYYLRAIPFLKARAQALRGPSASAYPGMLWQTETSTLFGSFCEVDWVGDGSCASTRPADLPLWLQNNPFIYLDPFGDGPTGELGLMILDRFMYDQDEVGLAARLPWIVGALEFVAFNYYNATSRTLEVSPTQACETLWSPWPLSPTAPERVVNDAPTIAVVRRLLERALGEIPATLAPPGARSLWGALLAAMPPLPIDPSGTKLASAGFFSGETRNSESVAMYSTHPARMFSVGRLVTKGVDSLALPIATFLSDPFSGHGGPNGRGNDGWHQGCMHAPLLGLRNLTGPYLVARTQGKPLPGFRFPFFSGEDGMADEAAAETFSNMQAGVQYALMQPGDDEGGSVVVFGGWPCEWDVHFKLWGPWNTSVEGVWEGGALLSLNVTPSSRAGSVIVAPGC